jgi:predicted lipoprotein with Yx(FWY)xxD motif
MTMTTITDRSPRPGPGRPLPRRWGRRQVPLLAYVGAVAVVAVLSAGGRASAAAPTVLARPDATYGTILTTGSGLTLYTFDTDHNGQSTCHGSCAAAWPPLTVPAGTTPTGGPGVTGVVGSSEQSNGTFQVTYNGSPLYTFVGDSAPGQVTGNGVAGFSVATTGAVTTTTTTTPAVNPPVGTAPAGGTASAATAPATSPGTTPPVTASSGGAGAPTATPGAASASPRSLAFTGAGPGLAGLLVLGIVLALAGSAMVFGPHRRRPDSSLS